MFWSRLVEKILDLSIVKNDVGLKHHNNKTSADFSTLGKLRFTVEMTDYEVSIAFREYGAEPIRIIWGGKVILSSIYGQEQQIIKRIIKFLRKQKLFFSFDELNEKELALARERKVILNKGYVCDDDGDE